MQLLTVHVLQQRAEHQELAQEHTACRDSAVFLTVNRAVIIDIIVRISVYVIFVPRICTDQRSVVCW